MTSNSREKHAICEITGGYNCQSGPFILVLEKKAALQKTPLNEKLDRKYEAAL